jgi:hypothetical protein
MFTDARPYPAYARWLDEGNVPSVVEVMHHNIEHGFPFNSPRLAWEIVHEYRKFENCRGLLAWFSVDNPNSLMRKALAYYGARGGEYSDEPWLALLEQRFGDRTAAGHFLKAYDLSARIAPELNALAWTPHDLGTSRILVLPYWHWTDDDPRWNYFASPVRGGMLLPLRYYAKVVARFGDGFRDNSGADFSKNREHPGSQELNWGLGDYPITPEAHMRKIRQLGEECFHEAEQALRTVRANHAEAQAVCDYMRAYQLLTDYYERKVLAAVSALIYRFGGDPSSKAEAERLADEAVERYRTAIDFIWEKIDKKSGGMKGRRLGGKSYTLPELIEREVEERGNLAELFDWPNDDDSRTRGQSLPSETAPRAGTFVPER